jgi:putative endonuclease
MGEKTYYVYILASRSRTLYTGVTGDLENRILEKKQRAPGGFPSRYYVTRLVYYEVFGDPRAAIAREKEIKGWRRAKKVALIQSTNPKWLDVSGEWFSTRRGMKA